MIEREAKIDKMTSYHLQSQSMGGRSGHSWVEVEVELQ